MNKSFAALAKFTKTLPPKAQKKAAKIRIDDANYDAAQDGRFAAQQAKSRRKRDLQSAISRYRAENVPENAFADEVAELEEITQQLADEANSKPKAPWPGADDLSKWLALQQRRGVKFELLVPEVKLPKGQTALNALREQRESIVQLRREREKVLTAPLTVEESEAKAVSNIENMAAAGAPDFRPTMRLEEFGLNNAISQGDIRWPQTMVAEKFIGNGLAFSVWLHKDALIARAKKEIRAMARDNALSVLDRKKRSAELDREILEAERVEEVLYEMALAAGDTVERRRPMNMLAILQLKAAG